MRKLSLSAEEIRVLRRETHGKGNLVKEGLIVITDAGKKRVHADDVRVKKERASGGKLGGRPVEEKGRAK